MTTRTNYEVAVIMRDMKLPARVLELSSLIISKAEYNRDARRNGDFSPVVVTQWEHCSGGKPITLARQVRTGPRTKWNLLDRFTLSSAQMSIWYDAPDASIAYFFSPKESADDQSQLQSREVRLRRTEQLLLMHPACLDYEPVQIPELETEVGDDTLYMLQFGTQGT